MLEIPLYIFLLVYILFTLGAILFFLFDLYHIIASGELSVISLSATAFIGVLMAIVILFTWYRLSGTDWNTPFSFRETTFSSFESF